MDYFHLSAHSSTTYVADGCSRFFKHMPLLRQCLGQRYRIQWLPGSRAVWVDGDAAQSREILDQHVAEVAHASFIVQFRSPSREVDGAADAVVNILLHPCLELHAPLHVVGKVV